MDGIIKYLNRRLANMWSSTVEEIIDTPFFGYIDPGCQRELADRYKQRIVGKHIPAYELTLIWQDDFYCVSIGQPQLENLREYIRNQEQHHMKVTWEEELGKLVEENKLLKMKD